MPKETIQDLTQKAWHVEVTWKRDEREDGGTSGHVQVASVNTKSSFTLEDVDGDGMATPEKFDGWRITVNADEIAQLRSVLAKAQRQAFPKWSPKRNRRA